MKRLRSPSSRRASKTKTGIPGWVRILAVGGTAFLLWEVAWFTTKGVGFSHSWETLGAFGNLSGQAQFWVAVAETLGLSLSGLALGLVFSLVVGAFIGSSEPLDLSTRGVLNFSRSIPAIILLPLFMATIGSFGSMVVAIVTTVVFFKLVVFVIRGVRDTEKQHSDAGRVLGFDRFENLLFVSLPSASILVLTGLRLSASRAYGTVVLAGVIAGTPGIGYQIALARLTADSSVMLAYALVAGIIGVVMFYGFSAVEKMAIRWRAL